MGQQGRTPARLRQHGCLGKLTQDRQLYSRCRPHLHRCAAVRCKKGG